jgi:type I site-specific restriction-modification system R (restriction) subunit
MDDGTPTERLQLIPAGQEHILEQEDGKKRWLQVVAELSRAFALCAATDEATAIRDDVSFFQALQAALNKKSGENRKTPEQIDAAIRQLVSKAITTEGQIIDVFTAAGLKKPDIGILSDAVPRRSARPQAQERRRRAAGEAAQGRTQAALKEEPRAEPVLRREAQEDPQCLPQPRHLDDGSHRGTDHAGKGNGRRHQARRRTRPDRRRDRLLRRLAANESP